MLLKEQRVKLNKLVGCLCVCVWGGGCFGYVMTITSLQVLLKVRRSKVETCRCFILIETCVAVSENGSHSIVLANSFVKESLVPFVVQDAELGRDVTKNPLYADPALVHQ